MIIIKSADTLNTLGCALEHITPVVSKACISDKFLLYHEECLSTISVRSRVKPLLQSLKMLVNT